jgi:putative oxidoreductase
VSPVAKKLARAHALVAVRIALGLIFVYAGIAKAGTPDAFAAQIAAFRIMPTPWAHYVAHGLPFFEAISGFWLLLGWHRHIPALAVLLISGVFTAVVAMAMTRGLDIECGCFGPHRPASWGLMPTLVLDLLLLSGAWMVYRNAPRSTC